MSLVAPSRGRGSKLPSGGDRRLRRVSLPHGGADRNHPARSLKRSPNRRSLTGARIETGCGSLVGRSGLDVAPSRGRGSKHLHLQGRVPKINVAPSRGRGSKPATAMPRPRSPSSLPHGGADRNLLDNLVEPGPVGSLPHGGADRNGRPRRRVWSVLVAPSRGRGSKQGHQGGVPHHHVVAPSRGRGSKHLVRHLVRQAPRSLPHGGADRNIAGDLDVSAETVAPSRGRGSKLVHVGHELGLLLVAPSRGRGSKRAWTCIPPGSRRVAPSRGRGSKRLGEEVVRIRQQSLPHGGADRNSSSNALKTPMCCRSLTGARIETPWARAGLTRPAGRSLTGARIETAPMDPAWRAPGVAPSRGRGSKRLEQAKVMAFRESLPHGGADRNVDPAGCGVEDRKSLPHGGADRNSAHSIDLRVPSGRSLTGARIETTPSSGGIGKKVSLPHGGADRNARPSRTAPEPAVAPSRGRGSKRRPSEAATSGFWSLPHGGADRNLAGGEAGAAGVDVAPSRGRGSKPPGLCAEDRRPRRSLTGARIETIIHPPSPSSLLVAPSRGRGSKLQGVEPGVEAEESLPHGGADRNMLDRRVAHLSGVSLPHGGADRNNLLLDDVRSGRRRSLTGARIETPAPR